jgi:hypothetical protein
VLLGSSLLPRATVAALLLLAASSTTSAADRFVSTIGSDAANDCLTSTAPCQTVGHALAQVVSGDTLKIADGTYTEDTLFIGGNTTLVVSGGWTLDFGSQDPRSKTTIKAPHVAVFYVFAAGTTIDLTLDNLTIGPGDTGVSAESYSGGSLTLTVVDSLLKSNKYGYIGGGISVAAYDSSTVSLIVSDSILKRNAAVVGGAIAALAYDSSNVTVAVTNSTMKANTADQGGAIDAVAGGSSSLSLSVSGSTLSSNGAYFGGGAVYVSQAGSGPVSLTADDCTFSTNRTGHYPGDAGPRDGGALFLNSGAASGSLSATVVNSAFRSNKADRGGGVSLQVGAGSLSAAIVNSTFRRNRAHVVGGAINMESGAANGTLGLTNTILWGNSTGSVGADLSMDQGLFGAGTITVDADHCDIGDRSTTYGTFNDLGGNIDADPRLSADLHLRDDSPAIDTGTCTGAPATDFDGDSRPDGGGCDMGADEFVP